MTVSEADDITVTADERREGRSVVSVIHGNFTTSLHVSDGELRRIRDAIDAHLSTPPADDVREALARPPSDALIVDALTAFYGEERDGWSMGKVRRMRAALTAVAFEVRPYGTVTDTEVKAAAYAMYSAECRRQGMAGPLKSIDDPGWSERHWSAVARVALEAAKEARS